MHLIYYKVFDATKVINNFKIFSQRIANRKQDVRHSSIVLGNSRGLESQKNCSLGDKTLPVNGA